MIPAGWTLRYDGFIPAQEGLREALCTLGSGYFATRGAAPESRADGTHYPGTYIAGCYNPLRTDIAGRTVEAESLVNAPNWLPLSFAAGDGPWLDAEAMEILECWQELDMQRGVLTWRLWVRGPGGRTTRVDSRRFVHMGAAHLAALETVIAPENWSGRLRIRSELDGSVRNTGVPRYRELASRHLRPIEARSLDQASVLLVVETAQSHIRIAEAARTRVGTTAEGIHLGAMGGTVDVLERRFAGIELRGDILRLDPFWPKRLGTLGFSIFYRDHAITLSVGAGTVQASRRAGQVTPIRVACHSEVRELRPGCTVEFSFLEQQP